MAPLTFFKKPALRFALLLPFCLCVGQLTAEETKAGETGDNEAAPLTAPTVKFKIWPVPNPTNPNPNRSIKIVGAGGNPSNNSARPERVCHGGKSAPCETEINYRWLNPGSSSDDNKVLTIQYKNGVYWDGNDVLQQVNPDLCFGGLTNGALTLDGSTGNPHVDATITLNTSDDTDPRCFEKVFFFYDVECSLTDGNSSCPGIENLDPGTLIDNGRNAIVEGD